MKFNEKLFELRRQKGYSQEELADKLNVARQTISKWESGTTTPDFDNLIKLSKIFDISIDEFVGNDYKKEIKQNKITSKKRKIILRILIALLIATFIYFSIIVIKRYTIVDKISKSLVYGYDEEGNEISEFEYSKSIIEFERMENKSYILEQTFCKENIMKTEHNSAAINPHLQSNDIVTTRIEYIDGSNYYDIDMINKTYTKEKFDVDKNYYYHQRTSKELNYLLFDEYNFDTFGIASVLNKLKISVDFQKNINKKYNETVYNKKYLNYSIDDGYEYNNGKDNINLTTTYHLDEEAFSISLIRYKYKDDSKVNLTVESYMWYQGKVEDGEVAMPDLTGFTLIEK